MRPHDFDHMKKLKIKSVEGVHTITEFPVRKRSVYEGSSLKGLDESLGCCGVPLGSIENDPEGTSVLVLTGLVEID